jgi:hypothetical protein
MIEYTLICISAQSFPSSFLFVSYSAVQNQIESDNCIEAGVQGPSRTPRWWWGMHGMFQRCLTESSEGQTYVMWREMTD